MKFRLNLDYFTHQRQGPEMTWRQTPALLPFSAVFFRLASKNASARRARPTEPVEQRHRDLAASMQAAVEEALIAHVSELAKRTSKTFCLAGGVAFNCVANGKMLERTPFERIYVQPAAGDAGLLPWAQHSPSSTES